MLNSNKNEVASLIPEVYYDLIARVVPGAILIFGFFALRYECFLGFINKNLKDINIGVSSTLVLVFFLLSYFFGLFLTSITKIIPLINESIENKAWKSISNSKEMDYVELIPIALNLSKNKDEIKKSLKDYDVLIHEYVKTKDATFNPIIAKMRAEMMLFRSMPLCFFFLSLIAIFFPSSELNLEKTLILLLILFILSFYAFYFRVRSYAKRSCVYIYYILKRTVMKNIKS